MRILALDTTSEFGSIALAENTDVIEEVLLHAPDGFGQILFDRLLQLLERHGWNWSSIDGYASASGPGSFTGVRIGLAAVKGLAEANGVGAAGISNLMAMAFHGTSQLRAPFVDARRGEIYGGLYDARLRIVQPEMVTLLPAFLKTVEDPIIELLTPNPVPFAAALQGRPITQSPRALAGAIALLAQSRLHDPAALDANYVRRSDAELHWREA